jgi:hypothetical protein
LDGKREGAVPAAVKKIPRAVRSFLSEALDEKWTADVPARCKKTPASAGVFRKLFRKLYFTTTTPFMTGCSLQMYGISPFLRATNRKVLPGTRSPDSTLAPLAVTL